MKPTILDISNIIIPSGRLGMDPEYAISLYSNYLSELAAIACGVSAKDMGYDERRKATMVRTSEILADGTLNVSEVKSTNGLKVNKIAIVTINGMIRNEDGMSGYGMQTIADQLLKVKNEVIGAIFNITSGGGYMDGAETMVTAIREFGKPTVSLTQFAASAAYMIASETDQILLKSEMSKVGSIGTLIELNKEFKQLYKERIDVIYAETSPNKNAEFRQWLNDDLSGFVKVANEADKHFMKLVKRNRSLLGDDRIVKESLAGGMFYANDAIERGLVDAIGDNTRAVSLIQKLSK